MLRAIARRPAGAFSRVWRRVNRGCAFARDYWRNPVSFNERLNDWEERKGRSYLLSYPKQFGINISNVCNQQCLFCSLDPKNVKHNNWLPPELFARMKWLRFVSGIHLFAGSGEPLVNPHFPGIVRTVRKVAAHSRISTFTNGLALRGENLDAIVEHFNSLHISLNAAKACTYRKQIRGGDFDRVMQNLEELAARKSPSLHVELSMVLTQQTAGDVQPMIDLAARCKFHRLILVHYCPTDTTSGTRLAIEESVKEDASIVEATRKLSAYARERNVAFDFCESLKPPTLCAEPWSIGYITNDDVGDRIFCMCCSGIGINIYVDYSVYKNFKKVWNCQRMREIRRTINGPKVHQNDMCWLCKQVDKSDPDWKVQLHRLASERPSIIFNKYDEAVAFPRQRVA